MSDHLVSREDGVHVMGEMCSNCIFRPGNLVGLRSGRLRGMVDQAVANQSCIPCHKSIWEYDSPAICRGFFDRHAAEIWALRLALAWERIIFDNVRDDDG